MHMNKSEQINELAKALSEAQGEFPILQKRTKAYNYMYADLAEIIECIQPTLRKYELSLISAVDEDSSSICMTLIHSSGQFISTNMKIAYKADGKVNEMQAMGSAITYARRYAISCLLNLAADKETDDDGEASAPKNVQVPKPIKSTGFISDYQAKELSERLQKVGKLEYVLSHYNLTHMRDLLTTDYPAVLKSLSKLEEQVTE